MSVPAPIQLNVLVNGVPIRAELGPEAIEALRAVLATPARPASHASPYKIGRAHV